MPKTKPVQSVDEGAEAPLSTPKKVFLEDRIISRVAAMTPVLDGDLRVVRTVPNPTRYLEDPRMVMTLDAACECLAASNFMLPWIKDRIAEHLQKGFPFELTRGSDVAVEYRIAKPGEVIDLMTKGEVKEVVSNLDKRAKRQGTSSSRSSGVLYRFTLPPVGSQREDAFQLLQKQGRVLLELVAESGRSELDVNALREVLERGRERIKTKPTRDLIVLFRFHLGQFYKDMGLVTTEEGGEEAAEED